MSSDGSQRRRSINSIDADLSSVNACKTGASGRAGLEAEGGRDESMVVADKVGSLERGSSSGSLSRLSEVIVNTKSLPFQDLCWNRRRGGIHTKTLKPEA